VTTDLKVSVEPRPPRAASDGYILVVDDDPSICDTLATMLQFKGYRTEVAHTGPNALKIARGDPPDLVLLDLMMPEMDGLAVCRDFQPDPRLSDVRVLMLTARDGRKDVVQALEAGASDYVTKLFYIDELVARVHTNLEVKRYHDGPAAMLQDSCRPCHVVARDRRSCTRS
jgi:DNA-binding response OmpR family regulator